MLWNVPNTSLLPVPSPTSFVSRSLISFAAFTVKVATMTLHGSSRSDGSLNRYATRDVSVRVFPEPAIKALRQPAVAPSEARSGKGQTRRQDLHY
jgi:hypothetical protein